MDPILLFIIVGVALLVVLGVVGIAVTARSEHSLVEERLGRYLDDEQLEAREADKQRATPIGDWVNQRLEKSSFGESISRELARADLKVKPGEYIAARVIVAMGVGFIFYYFKPDGGPVITSLFVAIGAVVGYMLPRFWVASQQRKRLIRFNDQLADMLNLIVNGLRAGYSTMQAMEAVSREMPAPISDEFRRVVQEVQLGISLEPALDNLLRRIPSEDLDLVITAINVQREVGGNLAEILDTISFTIRERVRIKGEIRVLTSQVMTSGKFLAVMPLIIIGVLWIVNRPYMMQFFSEPKIIGIVALSIAAIMVGSGYFVMMKIADIDV
jgi:tight adherence protein B